jgi:predicted RecA/RadA family phage recombinase
VRNLIQPGVNIDATAPYALSAGDYALIGLLGGVSNSDAENGAACVLTTSGVFDLAADETDVFAVGASVYYSLSDKLCHASAQGDSNSVDSNSGGEDSDAMIGVCVSAKGSGSDVVRVALRPPVAA